jgi:hypothetical protein
MRGYIVLDGKYHGKKQPGNSILKPISGLRGSRI